MIKQHRFTTSSSNLFDSKSVESSSVLIPKNHWIGILAHEDEWVYVISAFGKGWVKEKFTKDSKGMELFIQMGENGQLSYLVG